MAIGRISGPMLFSNLERQGVDLAFQSNLLYLDVNNLRVGVLNASPQYVFDSSGNVKMANIVILGNTITSNTGVINLGSTSNIVITGGSSNNVLYTDGLGNLRWGQISELDITYENFTVTTGNAEIWYATTLNATTANLTSATVTNLNTSNIVISSGNVTANLTGNITGTNATFVGNVNTSWLEGNVQADTGNFNNINVSSNVNVTGTVIATANIIAQKITSPVGDLHISAATNNPNNIIRFDSVSAFDIPSGTTAERPPSPDYGYVRYNTDIGSIEWWGGSQWVAGSNLISTQQINPDGLNSVYTLNQTTVENAILVNINGTIQQAGAGAYSVSGNQITFSEVPLVTDIIEIRFLASGVAALTINFANIASNVSPSANVTYDLGSPNYRWRDLWLSGNTINIGDATLSVANGSIQSSLPISANVTASNIVVSGTRIGFSSGGYIEETEVFDGNLQPAGYYGIAINSSDDGIISLNALDTNAAVTSSIFVTNVNVQLNVANSTPGGNSHNWIFDNFGGLTTPTQSILTLDQATFNGHVVPSTNITYNLGSINNQWANLHVGGNVNLSSTTGTPSNTASPASWLKIYVSGTQYFLPLYQ
jgi:hypothetical protein